MKITKQQKQDLIDFVNSLQVDELNTMPAKTKISQLEENDIIHTATEAEYYRISILLHLAGKRWSTNNSYLKLNKWFSHNVNMCIKPSEGLCASLSYYKSECCNIIPSTQITGV